MHAAILQGLALLLCWALRRLEGPNVPLPVDAACLLAISDVVRGCCDACCLPFHRSQTHRKTFIAPGSMLHTSASIPQTTLRSEVCRAVLECRCCPPWKA